MSDVYIEGLDRLLTKLDSMTQARALEDGITKACAFVEGQAKKNLHDGISATGELAMSITHVVKDGVGVVGTNKEYAPYVEIGTGIFSSKGDGRQTPWVYWNERAQQFCYTVGMPPRPYLRPALVDNVKPVKNLIFKSVLEEVRKK